MRALVIDDSRAARMVIGKILKKVGFEIEEAENGRAALDRLRDAGPFDLATVDWNMPVMNGYEFIQRTRSDTSYKDLTLIMVTTENEQSQVLKALSAGANEYLMKPFTEEMMTEKLEMLDLL